MTQCKSGGNGDYLDGQGLDNNQKGKFDVIEVEFFHIIFE